MFFFFYVPIFMASDGCELDELQFILLYEFNVELSIVVSFPTTSEALRVGTCMEKYFFSSMFHFSWPRKTTISHGALVEQQCTLLCIFRIRVRCDDVSFPAPSETLKLGKVL